MPSQNIGQHTATVQEQRQRHASELIRREAEALAMSTAELEEAIENEKMENPALEEKVTDQDTPANDNEAEFKESAETLQRNDYPKDSDDAPEIRTRVNNRSSDDGPYYERTVASEETLAEHLTEQINSQQLTDKERLIAQRVIGNIDSNGWLLETDDEIAYQVTARDFTDTLPEEVEPIVRLIQKLDPPGVGCHNLRECLLLQLRRKPATPRQRLAVTIIDRYFDDFSKKHYDHLCTALGITREELHAVVSREILTLHPKPGSGFSVSGSDLGISITPDFTVETDGEQITLTLNNKLPQLQISETYTRLNAEYEAAGRLTPRDKSMAAEIKNKVRRADDYIAVLRMRQETLFATMRAIVDSQRDYFINGDESMLKPLTQEDIARKINRDISVVSRAITNKYVDLPWGVKSLKSFFSEGIKRHGTDEEASAREVEAALREIVDAEDKQHPLSDDKLCKALNERGYAIARRTVAKYRYKLGIPKGIHRRGMTEPTPKT